MTGITLDEHCHIESKRFASGAMAGVIEGSKPGTGRIVYSLDGRPQGGYDRVWGYDTLAGALEALGLWDGRGKPRGFARDYHERSIEGDEL